MPYLVGEGHDGTGKSTQMSLMADWLREQGERVVIIEEPGSDDPEKGTPIANELRKVIKNGNLTRTAETNLLMFTAARRELWTQKIAPLLGEGAYVLSARNYLSTIAYQGFGEGLDIDLILEVTERFTHPRYMTPDGIAILAMANHIHRDGRIAQRGVLDVPDTFESRDGIFQEKVNNGYVSIASLRNIPVIDATRSRLEIHEDLKRAYGLAA